MKALILIIVVMAALLIAGCTTTGQGNNNTNYTNSSVPVLTSNVTGTSTVKNMIVEKGDTVAVDYLGKTTDGKVFDTSIQAEAKKAGLPLRPSYAPLSFTVGAGQMIAGFDSGVLGMKVGEKKTLTLAPKDAYGEVNPALIITVEQSKIVGDGSNKTAPLVGMKLQAANGAVGTVTNVSNGNVTIDFNQELAGKTLIFEVTLRDLTKK